nr:hypothetical protein [uncultured Draconibacterium sp.]
MKNWILNLIIGILVIAIIVIISVIASNNLTSNESTLLSVLLTVLSIIGSWIVSSYFSKNAQKEAIEEVKSEHQSNLRTYALNAAEKVNNLSNELAKLANYLRAELEQDDESDEYALNAKIERIESAIHIVNTLKSVNDTSLSDWKGVIGDVLEEREEEKEEREERLLELTEKIENIFKSQKAGLNSRENSELTDIKKQLDFLSKNINSTSINLRTTSKKPQKEKVEKDCPNCGEKLNYTQRENIKGHKTIKCSSCGKRILSRYSIDKGFYLIPENLIKETFNCPWCNIINEREISNIPFTKEVFSCKNCGEKIKATRKLDLGLSISSFGSSSNTENKTSSPPPQVEISEELLDKVKEATPNQPWPEHVHKIVAEKVDISNRTAYKCLSELIERGIFNPQINGVVYIKSDLIRKTTDNNV